MMLQNNRFKPRESRPGEFHPEPLAEPDGNLSAHPLPSGRRADHVARQNGTWYKYKTVMGTVFRFGQAEGLLPLGEAYNPISYVTGIPATSDYEAVALTPEQALKVLDQLQQPDYTMIVLVAVTGIRSGEMLGPRWRDILWDRSEMKIKQTFVHGKIQQGAKTKLSKSTVALHPILAQLLKD